MRRSEAEQISSGHSHRPKPHRFLYVSDTRLLFFFGTRLLYSQYKAAVLKAHHNIRQTVAYPCKDK